MESFGPGSGGSVCDSSDIALSSLVLSDSSSSTGAGCHGIDLAKALSVRLFFTCDKCREIVRLTENVLELETQIQTLVEDSKNVRAVDTALDATSSGSPVHCSVPVEPVQQGTWVTEVA